MNGPSAKKRKLCFPEPCQLSRLRKIQTLALSPESTEFWEKMIHAF